MKIYIVLMQSPYINNYYDDNPLFVEAFLKKENAVRYIKESDLGSQYFIYEYELNDELHQF